MITVFLYAVFCVLPFYLENHHFDVGEAKSHFLYGIFVTFVYRCFKKGKEQPLLYIPAVCVVCYFAHNLVSFAQVINYPYVFLYWGWVRVI